jgi:hypothetical protein
MENIGIAISRVKRKIKVSTQDAYVTDRYIYSLIIKALRFLIRRQDTANKIMIYDSLFKSLKFTELIEIDPTESECNCVSSNCKIKRTEIRLPNIFEGYYGPIIRTVTSLDYSQKLIRIAPSVYEKYANQSTAKYSKNKYYWYSDGYLYFPNISWDAVRVDAMWEDDINYLNCDYDSCIDIREKSFNVPDSLFYEVEKVIAEDFNITLAISPDPQQDDKSIAR